jgi:hypothetical protein
MSTRLGSRPRQGCATIEPRTIVGMLAPTGGRGGMGVALE